MKNFVTEFLKIVFQMLVVCLQDLVKLFLKNIKLKIAKKTGKNQKNFEESCFSLLTKLKLQIKS